MSLVFEVTNARFGWEDESWEQGTHTIEDADPGLVLAVSCAHAAQAGVIVTEGLDEEAYESDEDSIAYLEQAQADGRWQEAQSAQSELDAAARAEVDPEDAILAAELADEELEEDE